MYLSYFLIYQNEITFFFFKSLSQTTRKITGCYINNEQTENSQICLWINFKFCPHSGQCTISPSLEDVNRLNEHINYVITKDEISMPLKKKLNYKAVRDDLVLKLNIKNTKLYY